MGSGYYPVFFWVVVVGFFALCEGLAVGETYWLGYWSEQYEDRDAGDVKVAL